MVPPPIKKGLLHCVLLCFPSQFLSLPSHAKPVTKEFRVVTSGFQLKRGNLNNESKYFQPMRENPLHCILKQQDKKLNLSRVLAEPVPFLPICTGLVAICQLYIYFISYNTLQNKVGLHYTQFTVCWGMSWFLWITSQSCGLVGVLAWNRWS